MEITITEFTEKDTEDAIHIWNQVVEDGVAFPKKECLDKESGWAFFRNSLLPGLPGIRKPEKQWVFISCILTM